MVRRVAVMVWLSVVCVGLMTGCDGDDDGGANNDTVSDVTFGGRNNSGYVDGNLGPGSDRNDRITRQISAVLLNPSLGIELGEAYSTRGSTVLDSWSQPVIVVRNVGAAALGFVRFQGIRYKDAAGGVLGEASLGYAYAQGSVGSMGESIWTDTCLAAGEEGVLVLIERVPWSQVATVEIDSVTATGSPSDPLCAMFPSSAGFRDEGFFGTLSMSFANSGSVPGRIALVGSKYILYDGGGRPLDWGFFDMVHTTIVVPPGGTVALAASLCTFEGRAERIRGFMSFEDPASFSLCALDRVVRESAGLPREARCQELQREWNRTEDAKERLYRSAR